MEITYFKILLIDVTFYLYSQIHIKFINQSEWISRILQSILNQF